LHKEAAGYVCATTSLPGHDRSPVPLDSRQIRKATVPQHRGHTHSPKDHCHADPFAHIFFFRQQQRVVQDCTAAWQAVEGCRRLNRGGGGDAPLTGISVTTEERANVTHQRVVEGCWELFGAAEGCGGLLGRVWVLDPNPSLCPASSILLTLSLGPLVGLAKRPALPLHSNPSQGWPSQREGPCRKNWSQLCALHLKGLIHTGGGTRIHTLLQQPWVHQHLSWPHCHHTHTPLLPGREHQQQLSCE
jgi:hypothetical protein